MRLIKVFAILMGLGLGQVALADIGYASSKAEAVRQAQAQVSGRVLKVEEYKTKYKVKLLQASGRVISIEIKRKTNKQKDGML